MPHYFVLYKPYGILSAFTSGTCACTLGGLFDFPKEVYPVGRLDKDSEGLLILTDDTALNRNLLHPDFRHEREYWAQVEGTITREAVELLSRGISINLGGSSYLTKKCVAEIPERIIPFPARNPPVRYRRQIPDSWIRLMLYEGKNRQVRRMAAAVGFPVLRLIRFRIQAITVADMQPGQVTEWTRASMYRALFPA
jgi:23S rRNA pseudouridine2457 synthase